MPCPPRWRLVDEHRQTLSSCALLCCTLRILCFLQTEGCGNPVLSDDGEHFLVFLIKVCTLFF